MYEEVSKKTEKKARAALMDKLWEQFEQFSGEEILDGRGASASVKVDGVCFYTETGLSTGIDKGESIDAHLEWLCEDALRRMQSGKTRAEAEEKYQLRYGWVWDKRENPKFVSSQVDRK